MQRVPTIDDETLAYAFVILYLRVKFYTIYIYTYYASDGFI
jgi:hypothetical protein